jgi:hypothetical protein
MPAAPNNGYIAGAATPVTITLPASPALGDIVRVAGMGEGGWIVRQGAADQVIRTRPLGCAGGLNWVSNEPVAFWRAMASSADGSRVVAVASDPLFSTTTNAGKTWSSQNSPFVLWEAVACSADGSQVVAGGSTAGTLWTSPDFGATWTEVPVPSPWLESWSSVASSADGVNLVAASAHGFIYTSTDAGAHWSRHASSNRWMSVACSADGLRAVAVGYYGPVYVSVNAGVSWVPHGPTNYWSAVASSAVGSRLVAAARGNTGGTGQIYLSDDYGVTWTPTGPSLAWAGLASSADGSRLFAVEDGNGAGGQVYTSTDYGLSWAGHGVPQPWRCITCSSDGVHVLAGASWTFSEPQAKGAVYTSPLTTTPGPAGGLIGGPDEAVELLYMGNSQFRVLSHEGTISAF